MKIKTMIFLLAATFCVAACSVSFTTAKLADFKFGKNDTATPPTTTFNVGEKVYSVADVSGSISKMKARFKLTLVDVQGRPKNEDKGNTDVDVEGSSVALFFFTPPLPGEYKVDVSLLDEDGKEVDKKSGTVSVKGNAVAPSETNKDEDSE